MTDKNTELLEICVRVRVCPEDFKHYPAIEKLTPIQRAIRMTEEKCVGDLRWMDGVDDIVDVQTKHIVDADILKEAVAALEVVSPFVDSILDRHIVKTLRCPTCDSPAQFERYHNRSIVQDPCMDDWHGPVGEFQVVKLSRPKSCPTCESPRPELHPSMQPDGGEVQICKDPWHRRTERRVATADRRAQLSLTDSMIRMQDSPQRRRYQRRQLMNTPDDIIDPRD
jgi:hypothetical protein